MPRTHFILLFVALARLAISLLQPVASTMTNLWNRLPVHCSRCCHSVGKESVSPGELFAWCPHCRRIFDVPLFKAPSWVTGVLLILVLNLQ